MIYVTKLEHFKLRGRTLKLLHLSKTETSAVLNILLKGNLKPISLSRAAKLFSMFLSSFNLIGMRLPH